MKLKKLFVSFVLVLFPLGVSAQDSKGFDVLEAELKVKEFILTSIESMNSFNEATGLNFPKGKFVAIPASVGALLVYDLFPYIGKDITFKRKALSKEVAQMNEALLKAERELKDAKLKESRLKEARLEVEEEIFETQKDRVTKTMDQAEEAFDGENLDRASAPRDPIDTDAQVKQTSTAAEPMDTEAQAKKDAKVVEKVRAELDHLELSASRKNVAAKESAYLQALADKQLRRSKDVSLLKFGVKATFSVGAVALFVAVSSNGYFLWFPEEKEEFLAALQKDVEDLKRLKSKMDRALTLSRGSSL